MLLTCLQNLDSYSTYIDDHLETNLNSDYIYHTKAYN